MFGNGGPGAGDEKGNEGAHASRGSRSGRDGGDGDKNQTTFTRVGIEYGQKFTRTYTDLQTIKERVIDVNNNNTWRDQLSVERNFDRWNEMSKNDLRGGWSSFASDEERNNEKWLNEFLERTFTNPYLYRRPVVLDLDENGLDLRSLSESGAFVEFESNGFRFNSGWVSGNDGILSLDANGNGIIDGGDEFVFAEQTPEDDTDLQALSKLYDTNNDGVLSLDDEAWDDFRV